MKIAKRENVHVSCIRGTKDICQDVVSTATRIDYCLNTVSCTNCRLYVSNPNYKQNVGPLHWRGIACKQTGTDVKDFAEDTKKP